MQNRNIIEPGRWHLEFSENGDVTKAGFDASYFRLLGYGSEEEYAGSQETWAKRLHPDDFERVAAYLEDVRGRHPEGMDFDIEYRLRTKRGYRWFHDYGSCTRRDDGSLARCDCIVFDIQDTVDREANYGQSVAIARYMMNNCETAYYCNLTNDTARLLQDRGIKSKVLKTEVLPFRGSVRYYAEKYVHAEDRREILEKTEARYMREKLLNEESYTFEFRDVSSEAPFTFRGIVMRGEDEDHAVLIFLNVTDELRKEVEHSESKRIQDEIVGQMMAGESVYLVNLETDDFNVIYRNRYLTERYNDEEGYAGSIAKYINSDVHVLDRERMRKAVDPSCLAGRLKTGKEVIETYRDISSGVPRWYRMRAVKVSGPKILLGFSDYDREYYDLAIHRKIEEDYFGMFIADLDTQTVKVAKKSPYYETGEEGSSAPYVPVLKAFAATNPGETREFFENLTDLEYIRRAFAKENKISYTYKSRFVDGEKWVTAECIVLSRHENGSPAVFALGFALADSFAAEKQELLVRLNANRVVIEALSADFECVNYVVLKENKLDDLTIPYRTSRRIKAMIPNWEQETRFHNKLKLLIDKVGYGDDIKRFYAQTRREVILKHLEEEPAYYVNARAVDKRGRTEYFQFKFTADRDSENRIIGLVVGIHNIDDEMRQEMELRQKVEKLVDEKTEELKSKNRALSKVNEKMISTLGEIVESRDEESGRHINRVRYLTGILGMQVLKDLPEYNLTVEDVTAIAKLSPLHDLGKIKIPDSILLKPGKLTAEEFEIMKTHCDEGCRILKMMFGDWSEDLLRLSTDICRYHHEKWDGKGYPCGLKGDEIPISAQIVSIADVYDALVSERCYKKAYSHDEAFTMIMEGQCGKYSDRLLSCLAKCRDAFAETEHFSQTEDDGAAVRHESIELISEAMPLIEEISESMPGAFFIYQADEEEKLIYFNDIMVEYFGCSSREEFIDYTGNSFKGIVHPEDYPSIDSEIDRQIHEAGNNLDHVTYRIVRKDGAVRWLDDYGRLIRSGDMGDVFFVFATDFTETYLRRSQEAAETEGKKTGTRNMTNAALNGLKVLVVDDSEMVREINCELLEEAGAIVVEAENGLQAVSAVKESMDYDLILMDLVMPVMSGVSATREISKLLSEAGRHSLIICLTAEGSDMQIKEALDAGAYECMYKPLNISELSGHVIASIRKTTQMMEKRLADTIRIANTDALTNAFSIAAFTDKISELSTRLKEDPDFEFGIVACDCNNLKGINDTYGHDIGDQYIRNTSNILNSVFSHSQVFRIGGDEFAVILEGDDYSNAAELMAGLRKRSATFASQNDIVAGSAGFSAGLAVYDRNADGTVGAVIKRADEEMYNAKRNRKTS